MAKSDLQPFLVNNGGFKGVSREFTGLLSDPSLLYEARNVQFIQKSGQCEASHGYKVSTITSDPPEGVTFHAYYNHPNGLQLAYGYDGADAKIYKYSSGAWSGVQTLSALFDNTSARPSFFEFLDKIYLTNPYNNEIYSSPVTDGSTWTSESSFPFGAIFEIQKGRLLQSHFGALNKNIIIWSGIPDAFSYAFSFDSTNSNTLIGNNYDDNYDLCTIGNQTIVIKKSSVYKIEIDGEITGRVKRISSNIGGATGKSKIAVPHNNICYFMGIEEGVYGVYATDGEIVKNISAPMKDLINSADPGVSVAGRGRNTIKFFCGQIQGSDPSRYLEIEYAPDSGIWQYRVIDIAITMYNDIGYPTLNRSILAGNKIYEDEVISTSSTPATLGGNKITSELITHFKVPVNIYTKTKVAEIYITGEGLNYISSVEVAGISNESKYEPLINELGSNTIFGGTIELEDTQFKLRILTSQAGWKIEGVFLRHQQLDKGEILQ